MKRWASIIILLLLFFISLEFRLFFAFQTPHYSSESAYDTLRNVEHILDTGRPITQDSLVERQGAIFRPPLFSYLLAGFSLILPFSVAMKVIPALLASLLVFLVYFLALQIAKNESAALFAAFLATFTPILYETISANSISPYTLAIPLMFLLFYCFMRIEEERYLHLYLVCLILLPLIHPIANIIPFAFIIYLLLLRMERIKQSRAEVEILLLTFLYIIWVTFVFYKNALLIYGTKILWQNIPTIVLDSYFVKTTVLDTIFPIGIIPFLFGLFVIYKHLFVQKDPKLYLLFSLVITMGLLLWWRLIELQLGLLILAILACILFAKAYSMLLNYIEKTNFAKLYPLLLVVLLFIVVVSSIYPSISYAQKNVDESISPEEVYALQWMDTHVADDAKVLSPVEEGHYISAIAKKKVIADTNYLLIENIDEVLKDIDTLYTTQYETVALTILEKYDIQIIYLSPSTKERYGDKVLVFTEDEKCFKKLLDYDIEIYEVLCTLQEGRA